MLNFQCQGADLIGIVSAPVVNQSRGDIGVIIVVGGPQYRVGSHRLFVRLARSLAQAGHTALRFDYRGMGDSAGNLRDFLAVTPDINSAIDALLATQTHLKRVVLWGLCDGASASLLYCDDTEDDRVCACVLVNPWVRSSESLARTRVKHYYLQRVRQPEFWKKLFSGSLSIAALQGFGSNLRQASKSTSPSRTSSRTFQDRMTSAGSNTKRKLQIFLSGNDYTAKEFIDFGQQSPAWRALVKADHMTHLEFKQADHTFSDANIKNLMIDATIDAVNHHR
ncbi:hydrolase 1, exosortase A system-associated [Roseateles sp.]|uniref:hydrolase 1, exosortase A system-associated n=1 Tax=Roseateles sp. TaxID=1971397 RepID=UPI00286C2337|nr:hydrolase 1, exosortase A system-associated [Roseateles sp.]